MTTRANAYSLKKPNRWLWRAHFTREQVLQLYADEKIAGDWMVCPLGEADQAVSVASFVADPNVLAATETVNRVENRESSQFPADLMSVVFIVGFVNLMIPALLGSGTYFQPVVALGLIGAQIGLVAVWGVFSSEHFTRRLIISAAVGLVCYGAFALGILAITSGDAATFLLFGLLLCPLIFFSTQLPLWAARIWLGFEVAKPDQPPRGSYRRATRIQDLIIGTAAVGVALSLVRMTSLFLPAEARVEDLLTGVVILACVVSFISLVVITPLLFITLVIRYTVAVVIFIAVWMGVLVTALVSIVAWRAPFTTGAMEACLLGGGTFVGALCMGLLAARSRGYRLCRHRQPR